MLYVCVECVGLQGWRIWALKALRLVRETWRKWLLLKSLQGSALSKTTLTLSDPLCDLADLTVVFLHTDYPHNLPAQKISIHSEASSPCKKEKSVQRKQENNCIFFFLNSWMFIFCLFFRVKMQFHVFDSKVNQKQYSVQWHSMPSILCVWGQIRANLIWLLASTITVCEMGLGYL